MTKKNYRNRIFAMFATVCLLGATVPASVNRSVVATVDGEQTETAAEARDETLIYSRPGTLPNGTLLSFRDELDFSAGSYDWIENDDWDWDTLASEYGTFSRGDGLSFYQYPAGGGYAPSFEAWIPAVSMSGTTGVMFFADFRSFENATDLSVALRIDTSSDGRIGDVADLTKTSMNDGVNYDYTSGDWVSVLSEDGGKISLPDSFAGYVYMPLTGYNGLTSSGVGIGCYVQMYHLDFNIGENYENTSRLILDDIDLVSGGAVHAHEYTKADTVAPDCETFGADIMQCSCGQVKWENLQPANGHTATEYRSCGEGLSAAICSECGVLVYSEEDSTAEWEEGVTVTYEYLYDGLEREVRKYPSGYTLRTQDIPYIHKAQKGEDIWQFFRFTTDEIGIYGMNPDGMTVTEDITLYAHYNFCSYDGEKFRAMNSDVSLNGGPYDTETHGEGVIFMGHSNFSLWHGMENWYAALGIPVRNNSIAGGSSYNFVEYLEELILMYRPKIVVTGLSSNDFCYHQMTDKTIMEKTRTIYERIHAALPDTQVILVSSTPLPGRPEYFTADARINEKAKAYCETQENLTFVETADIVWQYVLQYPTGWEFWTHMEQAELQSIFGTEVYKTMKTLIQKYNITF